MEGSVLIGLALRSTTANLPESIDALSAESAPVHSTLRGVARFERSLGGNERLPVERPSHEASRDVFWRSLHRKQRTQISRRFMVGDALVSVNRSKYWIAERTDGHKSPASLPDIAALVGGDCRRNGWPRRSKDRRVRPCDRWRATMRTKKAARRVSRTAFFHRFTWRK